MLTYDYAKALLIQRKCGKCDININAHFNEESYKTRLILHQVNSCYSLRLRLYVMHLLSTYVGNDSNDDDD